ncbi:hypothetical protein [Microterricola viridarii]|uniref:Gram-positive cocci surface proteins LPxTG domain-containing protein n=1 Tax=Microterricola viridarii TaxID=412690 RepID=A0A1H1N5H1_9MICO|nr:hypothetical protein [Microterricola viridarii]SDR94242.1 hypothetical protein SAMN04489834_0565 [Microterricola viridarii]
MPTQSTGISLRHVVLPGVAAATALALAAVAPASAEPADTIATVTTHTVAAASVAPMDPSLNPFIDGMQEAWYSTGAIAPAGPISFPHIVSDASGADPSGDTSDGGFVDNLFLLPATPQNCTRTVSSFSYSYDLLEVISWHTDMVESYSALLSGPDAAAVPMSDESASTDGIGWLEYPEEAPGLVFHGLTTPYADVMPLVGSITMAYPEPVDAATAMAYVGFGYPVVSAWTLTDASFVVTDTCTTNKPVVVPPVVVPPVVVPPVVVPPVVVPPVVEPPVVVPPVVVPPVVEPPVVVPPVAPAPVVVPAATPAQPLAETGVEAGAIGAAAALLLGVGAAAALFARRRATS